MKRARLTASQLFAFLLVLSLPNLSHAWHDETHLAIGKAAGYQKWYNAAFSIMHNFAAQRQIHFVLSQKDVSISLYRL